MASESLIVTIEITGSGKRYTIYKGLVPKGTIVFSRQKTTITATVDLHTLKHIDQAVESMKDTAYVVERELLASGIIAPDYPVSAFAIKLAVPGSFFLQNHFVDEDVIHKIKQSPTRSSESIDSMLHEMLLIRKLFGATPLFAVSDSAFHAEKSDVAWNYDIDLTLADRFEIKRFGYNGVAAESAVQVLGKNKLLEPRLIICHLSQVPSVTAIKNGKSINTSTGFWFDEGIIASYGTTRLSFSAVRQLVAKTSTSAEDTISGICTGEDLSKLFLKEKEGDYRARLALAMFVHSIQSQIGSFAVELGGVDQLIFSGDNAITYPEIRKRIVSQLEFLGFALDGTKNKLRLAPEQPAKIHQRTRVKPIYVVDTNESYELAWRTRKALQNR